MDYHALYRAVTPRYPLDDLTPAGVSAWQARLRPALRAALGLTRMEADLASHTPQAELLEREVCEGFVRERWTLTTEPDLALPFYLLRPDPLPAGRLPLVLTPHGHNVPGIYAGVYADEEERRSGVEGQRDIAVQAARQGYLAIAPTARGFGETRTPADIAAGALNSCRTRTLQGLLVGRTVIGERVWDLERLLDWALAEQSVDPARVAITGNSGGGTASFFAAACDVRYSAALPGSYYCSLADSIGSIYHCDCNYVPDILSLGELGSLAGLIAPRYVRFLNGRLDPIFPIEAAREQFAHTHAIYAAAGVPERCSLWIGPEGHRYYSAGAWTWLRAVWR
ncbi:MAG: hypothetical protein GXY52_11750 [Chloroflexi bacterium]|nr:hypothetical protein [Chloroflexota bacterium]